MKKIILFLILVGFVNGAIIHRVDDTSTSATEGWNITGSKYLINLRNILDVNETVFNKSIDERLISVYYNASDLGVVRGTTSGLLTRTMHLDGAYDGLSFNLTEEAGAVGLDIRFNFTGIEDFNKGILRYRTTSISGDYPIIQLWNYDSSAWEDYPQVVLSESFVVVEQSVFDSSDHLTDEIVQIRLYKLANGNTGNTYYIDWLAISKGVGTPSGNEVDPVYTLESGNIFGNLTFLLENASDQDARIIILEAGGGAGTYSPQWDTINGVITSNTSIGGGNVNVTGNLSVMFSTTTEENKKGFVFGHVVNVPSIRIFGGDKLDFLTVDPTKIRIDTGISNIALYLFSEDGKVGYLVKDNGSNAAFSVNNNGGGIAIKPIDTNDYIIFDTPSNIPNIGAIGGEDIYFYDTSTSNWNTIHADAFTEHTNLYEGNETQAVEDVEQWLLGEHPIGLTNPTNVTDSEICDIDTETNEKINCVVTESHIEYIGTDLGKSGKALVKYARRNRLEGKRILDRQEELIRNLLENGFLTQEQAINLRDNY